jgi:hypothetical protein
MKKYRVTIPDEIVLQGSTAISQWLSSFASGDIYCHPVGSIVIVEAQAGIFNCPFAEEVIDE